MAISNILEKLGRQQLLTTVEIEELKQWEKNMSAFIGGMQTGATSISVLEARVEELKPKYIPTNFLSVSGLTANQSIPDNTWTQVTSFKASVAWDTALGSSGASEYFEWDDTGQRINVKKHGNRFIMFTTADWDDNSTGDRVVTVDAYDKSDSYSGSYYIDVRAGAYYSTSSSAFPLQSYILDADADRDYYWELSILQDSGGPLDLTNALFAVGVIE